MLHFETLGAGDPVVLIHGLPLDHTSWSAVSAGLSQSYQVIMPDLPGAGKSEGYQGALSLEIVAKDILEMIDSLSIDKVIIAGHSMGGYLALECAQQFPGKIRGVSLVHSLASADTEEKKESRKKSIQLIRKGEEGKEAFLKAMVNGLFAESFRKAKPDVIDQVLAKGVELTQGALANFYIAIMHRSDKRELLKGLPFPVQWIIGTEDTATPMQLALEQSHLSPVSDVHILENVGHMSMYEDSERLLSKLSDFCHFCISSGQA